MECCKLPMVMKPESLQNGLNDLMMGVRIISMIQEVGLLQPLKILYPNESKGNIPA
jgi:hypothetical protein